MRRQGTAIDRRRFLRQSAALGLGTLFAPALASRAWAATKDRVVIYQGVSLDSLHPYGYSGGGITGIWRHIIEPLIQMDYGRKNTSACSPSRGSFRGASGFFVCAKAMRFHDGSPFTSKDVAFSIDRCRTTSAACRAPTCNVEVETPDDYTVALTTKSPMRFCSPARDSLYHLEGIRRRSRQLHDRHRAVQIRQLAARRQSGATRAMTIIGAPSRKSKK